MQYLLLLYSDETRWPELTPAERDRWMAAYQAYAEALQSAGALRGSHRLAPSARAATVRITDRGTRVLDGPYAESKEQLGGYFLIDVPDFEAALSWAARCPSASHGAVEVRPLWRDATAAPR